MNFKTFSILFLVLSISIVSAQEFKLVKFLLRNFKRSNILKILMAAAAILLKKEKYL
jgi:hypothetical protein